MSKDYFVILCLIIRLSLPALFCYIQQQPIGILFLALYSCPQLNNNLNLINFEVYINLKRTTKTFFDLQRQRKLEQGNRKFKRLKLHRESVNILVILTFNAKLFKATRTINRVFNFVFFIGGLFKNESKIILSHIGN